MIQLEKFERAAPIERPQSAVRLRRGQARSAWLGLFFGSAPLWVRFLVWAQRNNGG